MVCLVLFNASLFSQNDGTIVNNSLCGLDLDSLALVHVVNLIIACNVLAMFFVVFFFFSFPSPNIKCMLA